MVKLGDLLGKGVSVYMSGNHHLQGVVSDINIDEGFIIIEKSELDSINREGKVMHKKGIVWIPIKNVITISEI